MRVLYKWCFSFVLVLQLDYIIRFHSNSKHHPYWSIHLPLNIRDVHSKAFHLKNKKALCYLAKLFNHQTSFILFSNFYNFVKHGYVSIVLFIPERTKFKYMYLNLDKFRMSKFRTKRPKTILEVGINEDRWSISTFKKSNLLICFQWISQCHERCGCCSSWFKTIALFIVCLTIISL